MRAPDFWTGDSARARTCAAMLAPLGAAYGFSVRMKRSLIRPYRPKARVVCVGNLTVGGTGKTPVAIAIGEMLARYGKAVFLSRGFGGRLDGPVIVDLNHHSAEDVGDEPLLLAQVCTTIVARSRAS